VMPTEAYRTGDEFMSVAWLALQVAIGVPGVSANVQGAVGTLARTRFGWTGVRDHRRAWMASGVGV
jgi:hypothetical protein